MSISFFAADVSAIPLKNRKVTVKVLQTLFLQEQKSLKTLSYIFASDKYLLNLNMKFLNHNFYTDVITFDLSNEINNVEGEVYISVNRVRENAANEKVSMQQEIRRVILHGALHLCGYKDKTKSEITLMRELENKYLRYFDN